MMLQEKIVKNDSMCDMLRYAFIAKLQNFLIAPRSYLGPAKPTRQTAPPSVQPFFAGLTNVTDRQTDTAATPQKV